MTQSPNPASDWTPVTLEIQENFRGSFLLHWHNRLRTPSKESRVVETVEELETVLQSVLQSPIQARTQGPEKHTFTYSRHESSDRPCSEVIQSMIRALETARNEEALEKANMTEDELLEAWTDAERPGLKLAYRTALDQIERALPAWVWHPLPKVESDIEIFEVEEEEAMEEDIPFMIVEDMPGFGSCANFSGQERDQCTQLEIIKYVSSNTHYPPIAKDAGIQGTVFVYFVVGKDGKVRDGKVLRPVDPRLDAEALRVVNSLPDFTPGTQQGEPVSVQYTIPVKFIIRKRQSQEE